MTLVELLVVITIILVLAALSMMGLGRVRSAARGATCTSNLRQIGAAMISYATDNSGKLPPIEDRSGAGGPLGLLWTQSLADEKKQIYLAKVTNRKGKLSFSAGVWACPDCTVVQTNYQGYGAAEGTVMKVKRGKPDGSPGDGSLNLAQIPNPERTWLVGDTADKASDLKTGWYAIWADPKKWTGSHVPAGRHAGKVNVCMVDGHVESLTKKRLEAPDKDYTMFKK